MNEHNEPRCCFDAAAYTGTPDALPCPQVVDVPSTIKKLDEILNAENLSAAASLLDEKCSLARESGDWRSELSLQNEQLGLHRRTGDRRAAQSAVDRCLTLIREHRLGATVSGATVMLNAATTMKFLGRSDEALPIFRHVSRIYSEHLDAHDYRFAGLYNNMALSYQDAGELESAERHFLLALEVMRFCQSPENDTAVTWCNLAELYEMRGDGERLEKALDNAYALLCSPEAESAGGYYAFTLSKCIPAFDRLGFFVYAHDLKNRLEAQHEGT